MANEITYTWDEAKRVSNLSHHGVDFAAMECFDWTTALWAEDARGYGEARFRAVGYIEAEETKRLHVCIFTPRDGTIRIISLWKANRRDQRKYERIVNG